MKLDLWVTSFHLMYFCNNVSFYFIICIPSITICPMEYSILHTMHVGDVALMKLPGLSVQDQFLTPNAWWDMDYTSKAPQLGDGFIEA